MEREVGGGIGMWKTCKLKDVSFQCMTKFKKNKKFKKKEHSSNFSKLTQSTVTIWSIFLLGESDSPVESRIKEANNKINK